MIYYGDPLVRTSFSLGITGDYPVVFLVRLGPLGFFSAPEKGAFSQEIPISLQGPTMKMGIF